MRVCLFVPFFSSSASTISGSGIQRHQDISGCAVGQAQGWPGAPWLLHLLPGDGHGGMANSQQQTSDVPAVSAALLCSGTTLHSSAPAWSRVSVKKRTSFSPHTQAGTHTSSTRASCRFRAAPRLVWAARAGSRGCELCTGSPTEPQAPADPHSMALPVFQ